MINGTVKSRTILVKMGAEDDLSRGIAHVCGWAWRQTVTALRWGSQPWCSELDTCLPKMEQLVSVSPVTTLCNPLLIMVYNHMSSLWH